MARFSNPFVQFFDKNGQPLAFGTLEFRLSGAPSTLLNTYSDSSLNNANTNPVVLDGEGRLPSVFLDGVYDVEIKDKDGVLIGQLDPVGGEGGSRFAFADFVSTTIYGINDIVEGSDGLFYISLKNSNLGNDPTTDSGANWQEILFVRDQITSSVTEHYYRNR